MSKAFTFLLLSFLLIGCNPYKEPVESWIRVNNLGYLPDAIKVAVVGSKGEADIYEFSIYQADTDKLIYTSDKVEAKGDFGPFSHSYRLNFSDFQNSGLYYIKTNNTKSPVFKIDPNVYDHTADFLMKYMRQQRCGYNPYLADSCHLDDGYIIYHPTKTGQRLDVTGGWHDATDYLQYTTTSANAVFQLLFAYRENPSSFGDYYGADGLPGSNGIPDVLDEAKYGIDWLKKMNPSPTEYYNQIADDRDHVGFRLPNKDTAVYDPKRKGRPVYLASAEKQGLQKYQNRSTGVASTAGKYASAFAMGAMVLEEFYPSYTQDLLKRAEDAFEYGKQNPGVSQTAPCKGPYFYEEENWVDDMELAASVLYKLTKESNYREEALSFATEEKITPWMGRDTVNHYQYYPFLNVGHHELASTLAGDQKKKVSDYYDQGLELLYQRGKENPFFIGIPFVWCSNNFVTAAVTQCRLYRELTGDDKYLEMEAALRDWLFGVNPWGTSMIVGLPKDGDSPVSPHSSLTILEGYPTDGGLVDGPVYGSIFKSLIGLELYQADEYAQFQSDLVVYHDDAGDYSTNEPTMDGTASLVYYLSSLEANVTNHRKKQLTVDRNGAIIRGDRGEENLTLVFTGDQYADGTSHILEILDKYAIKGAFFLTGKFYRDPSNSDFITKALADGHYLGAHSDQHLLYNDWTSEKKPLVFVEEFKTDLKANYEEMARYGIEKEDAPYFLPPYEWHDKVITQWTNQMGLRLINYTPGTISHADYTTPNESNYRSSEEIMESIMSLEETEGLNGFVLLTHIGTHPDRTDKFYDHLDELIRKLTKKGYEFDSLTDLLSLK
ncbi:glycoside hydrolase family 9 protein [Galbibacter sp.]|uniref:glycoside hydrolase family 9 protein n=1 Tax=Galbibacter sp. TaxID=2918471 RepID=UPI003A90AE60